MQIIITSRQMELTPRVRQHIERKVQRLSRLVDEDTRVEVTVAEERTRSARDRYTVQLAIAGGPHPIRSEVSAANVTIALDLALDKVTTQAGRQKDRHTSTLRRHTPGMKILSLSRSGELSPVEDQRNEREHHNGQATSPALSEEHNEEIWSRVMEIRRVQGKPMGDQEAIAQMEALGLSFFPFFNEATNTINVMYRLEKGGYGLLLPSLE